MLVNMRYLLCVVLLHQFWVTLVGSKTLDVTDIRLADGSGPFEGRVEVQVDGVWGTVCDWSVDKIDASVMCRTMGLLRTAQFNRGYYGHGKGPIFAQDFLCNGHELNIRDCAYAPNTFCDHSRDIGLICTECGEISIQNGAVRSISADGRVLTISCNGGYEINNDTTMCLNGSWSEASITCTPIECGEISIKNGAVRSISADGRVLTISCNGGYEINNDTTMCLNGSWSEASITCTPIDILDIQLVNGIGLSDGRVEFLVNNTWVTVCTHQFDKNDALVICRMLGFPDLYEWYRSYENGYGIGSGPFYLTNIDCSGSETHMNNCTYAFVQTCSYKDIAALSCKYTYDTKDIRLVEGSGPNSGRLEIMVNETWGTVCSRYSYRSYVESDVMETYCRMFGLHLTMYNRTAIYGGGNGLIFKGYSLCNGPKESINNCTTYPPRRRYCSHYYDASLACTPCGFPGIKRGYLYSVNGTEFTAHCFNDYSPREFQLYCQSNGTWIHEDVCTYNYAYPLDIADIRLANSDRPAEGRVEFLVDGSWGTVCDNNFDNASAAVICQMIGLKLDEYYTRASRYGRGSGRIYVDNLKCNGSEIHINNCSYDVENKCTHSQDVSVVCTGPPLNITDGRLLNGTGPYDGRAEIKVGDTWGTICNEIFDILDTDVFCRLLGLRATYVFKESLYGEGSGPIFIDQLFCDNDDADLSSCRYLFNNVCSHEQDVSVACTECGVPDIRKGKLFSVNETEFTARCNDDYIPKEVKLHCQRNGTWIQEEVCTYKYAYPLDIVDIRLANSYKPAEGRVELLVDGSWGTVCDNSFNSASAAVICQMIGMKLDTYYTRSSRYGRGSGRIFVENLKCNGSENHINQCSYNVENTCTHSEDVSVVCTGHPLNITDGRLANGTGPYDGRAEIKVGDEWGTICDENFNMVDADVFCRMLGLSAARFFTGGLYGEGSGPIFIDQLHCNDEDIDLRSCKYLFLNECLHEQDVSVVCNGCGQPDISHWDAGYFSYNDTILYADCSYYRTYVGKLELTCNNTTNNWVKGGKCKEYRFPLSVTDIRLSSGPSKTNGRVELKSLGVWGTICDDNFGKSEADAICHMIGYPPAQSYYPGAYYGEGRGPIFVDDLNCATNSTHINNCTYNTYDNCNHGDDISVNCTDCGIPKPGNGSINSSATNYGAVVKVICDQNYMLVGEQIITCQISGTWSDRPRCELIKCGDPTPKYGFRNTSETVVGTVVYVSCVIGYNISGDAILTCQSDKTWTDSPACEIVDCGELGIEHGHVHLQNNKTTYGETARLDCWSGYILSGNHTVSCLPGGNWEVLPSCEIVDCGDPVPFNATANSTETTFNSVVEIVCDPAQNVTGNFTIICQQDGTWTNNPTCDVNDCGVLPIPHGNVSYSHGTFVGSLVTIRCNRGYELIGTSLARCLMSDEGAAWNLSVTCEIRVCEDPILGNGRVSGGGERHEYGSYAEIVCDKGYNLVGDNVIVCDDPGLWSDTPRCEIVECDDLSEPQNGYINKSLGSTYNAKIFYSCKEDYLLVGDEIAVCKDDGEWSKQAPTCVAKSPVGGPCISEKYCLMEDSKCVSFVCTCNTGIYDNRTKKCDTMPLLPFGATVGDVAVTENNTCGPKLTSEPGFPLFGEMHFDLFVCVYGYLSIGNLYTNPTPPTQRSNLRTSFQNRNRSIIAPFYAQIDPLNSGPVWYRTYDILSSPEKLTDDVETIPFIESIVVKFEKLDSFEASFVLVATWNDLKTNVNGFDSTKTSTFQVVLVSDGTLTYTFFIYGNGMMEWVNNLPENTLVWTGFSIDSVINTNAYSFTNVALQLDSNILISTSENDVAGLIYRSLNKPDQKLENPSVDCIRWYNNNFKEKKRLDDIARLMPECPCDIRLARFDPFFWHINGRVRSGLKYACVDMLHVGNFASYGKSCCYNLETRVWIYERPLAGGFQLYNERHYPREHIINDVIPKTSCCAKSNHCNLYYKLRPVGSCYRRSPYNFGSFWGDPHFITLDGMNFTFNGLGEYTLLNISSENCTFDLQARTERAIKENGELSDSTVFSAFAAKDSLGSTVHVERNIKKDGMNLYGNKIDLTRQFISHSDPFNPILWTSTGRSITISKRNESVNVLLPFCGISLTISIKVEMLTLTTFVPQTLKNRTKGLLGNYDDDPYNDFTLPNGTILNSKMTEMEVFQYGKTWSIHPSDSAFVYAVGKSHDDYHNDSYLPRFIDDVDDDLRLKAATFCNGVQDRECIFDYVFTEREEVANETQKFKLRAEADKIEIDEAIPTLVGCSIVTAEKGKTVSCTFNASDEVYFVSNDANATIDSYSSTITYVQTTEEPVNIRISSRNENGRWSPTFVLGVILCTDCSGHGVCKNVTRKDPRENEYFRYAACECEPEYEGNNCEKEFDGCAASPCSWNRTCEKLSAEEQKAQKRAYKCGPCPKGFTLGDADECIDVDECLDGKGGCEQNCFNFDGGYRCGCNEGYRTSVLNVKQCTDINECDEAIHNCDHLCNNTEGGFKCQCYNGYEYNTTSMSCVLTSASVCTEEQWNQCANAHGCTTGNGQPFCFCKEGYAIGDNESICIDIDECSLGVCSQDCMNTIGSFQCSCLKGYRLENVATCTECDILHWGNNCEQICTCNGRGADKCDPVKGCVCSAGWTGSSCNDDINECNILHQPCDDERKECVNNLGSYSCKCKTGFYETEEGICADVDECSTPLLNNCDQECENTIEGYICACKDGYTKLNNTSCIDVDECRLGTANCEQTCANSDGSYSCFCHFGYVINDDRSTCSKVVDPCWTLRNLNCSHFCLFEDDKSECKCQDGYMLESDEETCTDINECADSNKNRCDTDATCTNTDGSYQCKCQIGKRLENDGRTCSECDRFHYGETCSQTCSCLNGNCDRKIGCVCNPGWAGSQCDIDIDECSSGQVLCSSEKSVCVNTLGSAFCSCEMGYRLVSGICQDVNECATNVCDQNCINTDGSFRCTCEDGFILDDKCRDIDECSGFHNCNQICQNTVGSYRCLCEDGFQLNLDNRQICIAETECTEAENNTCTDKSYCYVSNGEVHCRCFKGYQNINGRCEDIDECLLNPCSQICSNIDGLFECSCYEGYSLLTDGITCQECNIWMYGQNCSSNCLCDQYKSEKCNHVTGTCTCRKGWVGLQCDEDVNECENESACPDHSLCENINGSFVCTCDTGFFKTGKGNCNECDKLHFGYNCFNECTCNFENTEDCQHDTGECMCNQGLAGDNCTDDINECDDIPDICEVKSNSTCKNIIGSYICECNEGFQDINSTCKVCEKWHFGKECEKKCVCIQGNTETCDHVTGDCVCKIGWEDMYCSLDINECAENASMCLLKPNSTCQNTNGSYSCDCDDYFHEQGDICTDCNIWTFGESCDLNCTCDTSNSQYCDPRDGSCKCNPGWNGTNCLQDLDECEVKDVCPDNSTCVNTLGSFYCECHSGYYMKNEDKCQECSDSTYGYNCSFKCNCNGTNSETEDQSCDRVTGECICKSSWGGNTCNEDINECEENKTLCKDEGNKTCLNTEGWYECDCIRGFTKQADTGDCVEDSGRTIPMPVGGIIINITVTFSYNLPNGTNLNASTTYEKLQSICEETFLTFIGLFVSETVQIVVIDIRSGSVEVDYTIVYGTIDSTVASKLTEAVFTLQKSSFVIFDGVSVNASSDTYINAEPCAFFEDIIGNCNAGLVCKLEGVAPTCRREEEEGKVNLPLITGLSAGSLFLFVIIAMVIVMARKFCGRQSIEPDQGQRPLQRQHPENDEISGRLQKGWFDAVSNRSWISNKSHSGMQKKNGRILTVSEASDHEI